MLSRSNGWVLSRRIDGSAARDAMGPYPLFFCQSWQRLVDDLADLSADLVSVVLVTDPFGEFDQPMLDRCFDRVTGFKEHYVADLAGDPAAFVSASHRSRARRALRDVEVTVSEDPSEHLEMWDALFADLCRRHAVTGIRAFSRRAFEHQLTIPGLVMFEARRGHDIVGLDLWYEQGDAAYGHLAAFSDVGYEVGASYATKWTMLQHFSERVRWVDLGGTPGLTAATGDGLAMFKAGWSNTTKPVYLCGRVLQPSVYEDLSRRRGSAASTYFPAYRLGEFE
jgi:hypothetical protein